MSVWIHSENFTKNDLEEPLALLFRLLGTSSKKAPTVCEGFCIERSDYCAVNPNTSTSVWVGL